MKVSQAILSFVLLFLPALAFGQGRSSSRASAKPSEGPALCELGFLPPEVQNRLKEEFASWKIQGPVDLSPRAHERWESEKPLECPGIAVGQFENARMRSYAVLLVPQAHADPGYKFLVFTAKGSQPRSYGMEVIEQSGDSGAANFFIHKVQISKFFNEQSRRKFHVQTSEGILLIDSAENEYEADVYFWADGGYQHQPVDY